MKNDRRKVFVVSMLVFLLCGGGIFTFFIMRGVEDLKDKPGFSSEYSSFPRKVMFAFMKAANFVDGESPDPKLTKFAMELKKKLFPELEEADSLLSPDEKAEKLYPSGRSSASSGQPYIPSEKIKSSMSSPGGSGGAGTQTTGSNSGAFSSGGASKGLSVSGSLAETAGKGAESKKLLARLDYMSSNIKEGLRSGSASQAKFKWDQSYVGNMGGSKQGKYSDAVTHLDKIRGEVVDLKVAETGGLKAPTPGEPVQDNPKNKETEDLKKSLMDQVKNDMSKGVMNSMFSGLGGNSGSNGGSNDEKNTFSNDDKTAFDRASQEYAFEGEEVISSKNASCDNMPNLCSKAGINGDVMVSVYPNGDSLLMANQGGTTVMIGCYAGTGGCQQLPK